jgi:hypothetical protein
MAGTGQPTNALEVGDILPRLSLAGPRGEPVDTSAPPMAGRANLLVFAGKDMAATKALLAALATRRERLEKLGARCFLVTWPVNPGPSASAAPALPGLGVPALPGLGASPGRILDIGELKAGAMRLLDRTGDAFRLVPGADEAPSIVVVGPNLHVIDIIEEAKSPDAIDHAINEIEKRSRSQESSLPGIHPPVLAVPDVFSPADNAHLMSIFHTRGQEYVEPGHLALGDRTTDCKMRIPDLGRRDRIDHWVVETDTQAFISERLRTRLFPEIQKAFNYQVTRHERYRLARYEGERGGEQMGHRDNVDPTVAHRRFAVTINLNAEAYQGAELRFPEFNDQLYKPASGTAIVFSCSLLHEVVGMREGSRFALLAFLFGDH